ncbi:hypothetical protein B0H14DRAFT_2725020 [Mycena olivaceomarginata]|nr:hypothetical protein B0H14DRAFT_2725020 [Mycena olivaceomarginata]
MNNLKSDLPRPRRIHTLRVHSGARIVCIPGENLVVTHTTGSVSCWDVLTSHRVGYLEIPDLRVQTLTPCLEINGKALFGAFIGRNVMHLAAIWIDFRNRANISISHTISKASTDVYFFRSHFFVTSRVLGFCTTSEIVFWGLEPNGNIEIQPQDHCCPPSCPTPVCLAFGRRLYIFHKGANLTQAAVYSVPFPPTPEHESNIMHTSEPPSTTTLPISYPFTPNQDQMLDDAGIFNFSVHSPQVVAPEYGVYAVTCTDLGFKTQSVVHFWPACRAEIGHEGMLEIGPGCMYGHPQVIRQIAVGATGRYVLIRCGLALDESAANDADSDYLGLLHFEPTSPGDAQSITFRKLDIRDTSLHLCHQIALDDALGLVLVSDTAGRMTAISYM